MVKILFQILRENCIKWSEFKRKNSLLSTGISLLSLSLEVFRLSILLTYNYCSGYYFLTYLEYPLILAQQSILFYYVLKFKNLLTVETVLLSMLVYLTIFLFMTEILPKIVLNYLIVSTFSDYVLIQCIFD